MSPAGWRDTWRRRGSASSRRTWLQAHQASHPRHARRDGVRRPSQARRDGDPLRAQPGRRRGGVRPHHRYQDVGRQRRARQRACSATPTRPTTSSRSRKRIPAAPSCPPRSRWRSAKAARARSCSGPSRSATTSAAAFSWRSDRTTCAPRTAAPRARAPRSGAVGAAASLARLDETKMRYALSYAAQQVSGLWSWVRDAEHVEKAFDFAGMGARNGVTAAIMVQTGFHRRGGRASTASTTCSRRCPPSRKPEEMVAGPGQPLLRHRDRHQDVLRRLSDPGAARRVPHAAPRARAHRRTTWSASSCRLPEDGARIVNNRAMPDVNCQHLIAVALVDGTRLVRGQPFARADEGPAGPRGEGARAARRRSARSWIPTRRAAASWR